jgi:hypothetical protein
MPLMEESELRVVLVIARQTFGWHRQSDRITVTQLMTKTGMARQSVLNGIEAARKRELVERTQVGPQAYSYELRISMPEPKPVSSLDRSNDETGPSTRPGPVSSLDTGPVYSLDTQKKLAAELKKLKETPPPPRARGDVGLRGGGGGETMEIDDVGDVGDVGSDVEDSQGDEAETANVKADLIDALAALGVRPEMAQKAVMAGTVTSDYDVILCKRFIQASTANIPAAVLWSQYLSLGRLPPAPYSETSTVTADQLAAARRMREESDRRAEAPGPVVGLAGLGAVLAGPTLRAMPPASRQPAPLRFPVEARR